MKILLFDIETSPLICYTWGKFLEGPVIAIKEEWRMLSVAYKWLGDKDVKIITTKGQKDDKALCNKLHKLFNEADVIIAHNGDQFDIKKARARFIYHNLPPTKHLATVDTKKVAKANFNFTSNSLDDLGNYLGVGRKAKHAGFDTWLGCLKDDKKSWALMAKYNKQDVALLERVYLKLRPYMKTHPSLASLKRLNGCPKCGSINVQTRGVRANARGLSTQMKCKDCLGWYLMPFKKEAK